MVASIRTSAKAKANEKDEKGEKGQKSQKGNGKKDHVRKKVWRPKTKTGCITCRIRRVKCDEARPNCQRCTSTGRKCDGYTTPAPTTQPYAIEYTPPPMALPMGNGLDLHSIEEGQAFHFFKHHTVGELSGFYDSCFWQFEVLQAAHTLPAVRHAIVAMGAMHRKFIAGRMPVINDDIADEQLSFAIEQANCAIREFSRTPAQMTLSESIDMMTASILFYCLACFQGHQSVALAQLKSGLKMLNEVDENIARGQVDFSEFEHHPISLHTLRAMFVTMDIQARGIMNRQMLATWVSPPKRSPVITPKAFKTFNHARFCFESLFKNLLSFMQELDVNPPTEFGATQRIIEKHQDFQRQFDEMSQRLDEFLFQLSHLTTQEDRESILGIRLFREQVKVYLRAFKGFDEGKLVREIDWHVDEHDMGVILELAGELLKAPPDVVIPAGAVPQDYYPAPTAVENITQMEIHAYSRPVFSACSGLLSALWLVTSKARSSPLRRRAIALMLDFPRREGVWDGVLAGRVAWESLVLEETSLEGELGARRGRLEPRSEYIPDSNKVRAVEINYVSTRMMEVEFRSVKQYEAKQTGVKKLISW